MMGSPPTPPKPPKPMGGTKFIGTLPASDSPWEMKVFGRVVLLVNPEHNPRMLVDGVLEEIKPR